MWVVFLLSAVGFAIGALILFSIGWLVIHKIEMHINRQDESFDIEKEVYKEIKNQMKKGDKQYEEFSSRFSSSGSNHRWRIYSNTCRFNSNW